MVSRVSHGAILLYRAMLLMLHPFLRIERCHASLYSDSGIDMDPVLARHGFRDLKPAGEGNGALNAIQRPSFGHAAALDSDHYASGRNLAVAQATAGKASARKRAPGAYDRGRMRFTGRTGSGKCAYEAHAMICLASARSSRESGCAPSKV
jgi:hypothetical protein